MSEENGADVDLSIAGQGVKLRNVKSLNTLATVATLILVVLLGYAFLEHKAEAKEAAVANVAEQKENTKAMREIVGAIKEQTCLNLLPEKQRMDDFSSQWSRCKQIARER